MPIGTMKSSDVIDALIRDLLGMEPEMIARLAHRDERVHLQRLPGSRRTTDPLDGLDVVARHAIAVALALRSHRGAVSLATEQQARDAGWPSVKLANTAIILGWALFTATESAAALPVLLEPDAKATRNPLLRIVAATAPLETLMTALHRRRRKGRGRADTSDPVRPSASRPRERRLASLHDQLRDLLGIDATTIEIPSDSWRPEPTSGNARAVHVWAVIALEMIELTGVMQREAVKAVRPKTEADACLAALPGARVGNLALLLAAALIHGWGYTCHVLPADNRVATEIIEAGRRVLSRRRGREDVGAEVVDVLELVDLARRGYVHVGRRAAQRVADRLFDADRVG